MNSLHEYLTILITLIRSMVHTTIQTSDIIHNSPTEKIVSFLKDSRYCVRYDDVMKGKYIEEGNAIVIDRITFCMKQGINASDYS